MEKKAFTLAEVLITLGIVGVVAAITIPGLITSYRAIVLESQFKEQYSRLAQALRMMVKEEEISLVPKDIRGNFSKYLSKYYNISHDCGNINIGTKGCITLNAEGYVDHYKNYTGDKIEFSYLDDGTIVLNDGTTLFFEQGNQAISKGSYLIGVDINGYLNKPNRLGHDLFIFEVGENGELIAPNPQTGKWHFYQCSKTSNSVVNGYGCAAKAIQDKGYFKNLPK